ncbi:MAG: insulinase family protein [Acidimicrobiales bacterium]|nr:insulinase family protein [Acidimicrobiales bacterium]
MPSPRSAGILLTSLMLLAAACSSSVPVSLDDDGKDGSTVTTSDLSTDSLDADGLLPGIEPIVDTTPLPVDPAVRIGTLENGLTYYLRRNDAPGGSLSVRLAVDAGSLQQAEPTDQIAHFTEHMLFNGTERYPGNTLDSELRALGAQIGPDLNAFTSFDETVYFLDVPLVGSNAQTAFTVLREWAGNATMDPSEVIAERGVVREEFRLRVENAGASVQKLFDDAYYAGTPYDSALPIGTEGQIMTTTAEDTVEFYNRWYRPNLMAVVVVGDLPLDDMENLVKGTFADLEPRGTEHPPREEPVVAIDTPQIVEVIADPGLDGTFISVDYRTLARDPGTFGGEQLNIWDSLITTMITNRLNESITSGRSSLVRGSGGPFAGARQMSFIGFNLDGPDLIAGTAEFLATMETFAQDGFSEGELQRARDEARAVLAQELAQLDTRQDGQWAELYFSHFLGGADASLAEDRDRRVGALIDNTSAEDLSGYFRWVMETSEPIVIVVGPDASALPDQSELVAVVDSAAALSEGGAEVAAIDEMMERPDRADISSTRSLSAAGGVEWSFDNGARVVFAESQIATGVVDMVGYSEGGWSLLEPQQQPLLAPVANMVSQSGVGDLEKVAMDRYLADKVVEVSPFAYETGEGFSGQASPDNLELAFQLIHLYLTNPRVDQSAFDRVILQQTEILRSTQNRPESAAQEALALALNGDNPRRNPVLDRQTLDLLTPESALALYEERLVGVDDLVLTVVGDVDQSSVEELARRYIGTIPKRSADTWIDLTLDSPSSVITVERTAGPVGGAGVLIVVFSEPGAATDADRIHAEVLQAVLEERLFTRFREELGASYNGGSALVGFLTEPDEESQLYINVAGDPARLQEIRATLLAELANLDAQGPTQNELTRALAVVDDRYNFISNGDIIGQLLEEATEDGPVLTNAAAAQIIAKTTRSQISGLAARVINTEAWTEIFVTPAE